MKLCNCFLVVGTAIFYIASTLLDKDIVPSLINLNPRYSNSFLAKKDFSVFTLKPADFYLLKTLSSFLI